MAVVSPPSSAAAAGGACRPAAGRPLAAAVRAGARASACLATLLAPVAIGATDFYVSTAGDDAAAGTSIAAAWRTIARVNQQDLEPGDRVLFQAGATFDDTRLELLAEDAGSPSSPIVITSWGAGRATLGGEEEGTGGAVLVYNAGGVELRSLELVGAGTGTNHAEGLLVYTDLADGSKLEHVYIDDVEISGFREGGLVVGAWDPSFPGFRDVRITRCRLFSNGEAGLVMYGYFDPESGLKSHQDVYIGHCEAYDNAGDPTDVSSHTGNGIVISSVDGAIVEYCHSHHNGAANVHDGGPVGLWAWDAHDVTIQHNISHHNQTGSSSDGGGFDFDGGVTGSVMQYNYSYLNDGAGFLIAQFGGAAPFSGNVVRYNVSANDGRKNGYAGILVWAAGGETASEVEIYGNTVYVEPAEEGSPAAFRSFGGDFSGFRVRNNLFVTTGGLAQVDSPAVADTALLFQGNGYWGGAGGTVIHWGGSSYAGLADWRAASGQESLGGSPVGLELDPELSAPSAFEHLTAPAALAGLDAMRLSSTSPAIEAGLDLAGFFGVDVGHRDFYGQPVPTGAFDIGAEESFGSCSGACTLDVDGDGTAGPLTDGVLVLRFLFGFDGASLAEGAVGAGAMCVDPLDLAARLQSCRGAVLDVDGNGEAGPLTDGLLILRYLFGFEGAALVEGALAADCTRCDPESVSVYLDALVP